MKLRELLMELVEIGRLDDPIRVWAFHEEGGADRYKVAEFVTGRGAGGEPRQYLHATPDPDPAHAKTPAVSVDVDRFTREQFADELEGSESELCDCNPNGNPPTNPWTKARLAHHCECAAVLASATIRRSESATRHARECACGAQEKT